MKKTSEDPQKFYRAGTFALFIVLGVYIGFIVFGDNGYMHLQQMKVELLKLKARNASTEEENNALFHSVHRLKNDPVYIEHVIRKQLQMNAANEIIFKFDENRDQNRSPGNRKTEIRNRPLQNP